MLLDLRAIVFLYPSFWPITLFIVHILRVFYNEGEAYGKVKGFIKKLHGNSARKNSEIATAIKIKRKYASWCSYKLKYPILACSSTAKVSKCITSRYHLMRD